MKKSAELKLSVESPMVPIVKEGKLVRFHLGRVLEASGTPQQRTK